MRIVGWIIAQLCEFVKKKQKYTNSFCTAFLYSIKKTSKKYHSYKIILVKYADILMPSKYLNKAVFILKMFYMEWGVEMGGKGTYV